MKLRHENSIYKFGVIGLEMGDLYLEKDYSPFDGWVMRSRESALPSLDCNKWIYPYYQVKKPRPTFVGFSLATVPELFLHEDLQAFPSFRQSEEGLKIMQDMIELEEKIMAIGRKTALTLTWCLDRPVYPILPPIPIHDLGITAEKFFLENFPSLVNGEPKKIAEVRSAADSIDKINKEDGKNSPIGRPVSLKKLECFQSLCHAIGKLSQKQRKAFWRASFRYRQGLKCLSSVPYIGEPVLDDISDAWIFFVSAVEALLKETPVICSTCRTEIGHAKKCDAENCNGRIIRKTCPASGCGNVEKVSIAARVERFLTSGIPIPEKFIPMEYKEQEKKLLKELKSYRRRCDAVHEGTIDHLEAGFHTSRPGGGWEHSHDLLNILKEKVHLSVSTWLFNRTGCYLQII